MKRADLIGVPFRVTSETSTVPLEVDTSTRRPALVASTSYFSTPFPESTTISTRAPLIQSDDTRDERHSSHRFLTSAPIARARHGHRVDLTGAPLRSTP